MESYFREHMASRQLSGFHETVAPHLAAYPDNVGKASAAQQRDYLTHLHQTLNAPSHPIRLRLTAASPDLLAIVKTGRPGVRMKDECRRMKN